MLPNSLQAYCMKKQHISKNKPQIFRNFLDYINTCRDPQNVFAYMEQRSICTFYPEFWLAKADDYADAGNFRDAFECIEEASSRMGILDNDSQLSSQQLNPQTKAKSIEKLLIKHMKQMQFKGKRSVEEFEILNLQSTEDVKAFQSREKLLELYQNKYEMLSKDLKKSYDQKQKDKQYSWLFLKKQKERQNLQKKLKSSSNRLSNSHMSLKTPIKRQDPARLTKTMDSVEMLKKKKSTQKKAQLQDTSKQSSSEYDDGSNNISKFNSLPIGKAFTDMKRRVTFSTEKRFQRIRSETNQRSCLSRGKKSALSRRISDLTSNPAEESEKSEQCLHNNN